MKGSIACGISCLALSQVHPRRAGNLSITDSRRAWSAFSLHDFLVGVQEYSPSGWGVLELARKTGSRLMHDADIDVVMTLSGVSQWLR